MTFPQMLPVALIALAQAQIPSTPGSPVSPPAREPAESAGDAVVIALVVLALVMIIDIVMRILDHKRRREADGIHLQTRISDALWREPTLTRTPPGSLASLARARDRAFSGLTSPPSVRARAGEVIQ